MNENSFILRSSEAKVNTSNIVETVTLEDLLENIRFLIEVIIQQKRRRNKQSKNANKH